MVVRSNDVSIALGANVLGTNVISNTSFGGRSSPWSSAGNNLAVTAGEKLAFTFTPTFGQSFGSIDGLSANIVFTAAVPEPSSYAMLLAGLGLLGAISRRRDRQ
jgi:hypothetical protein